MHEDYLNGKLPTMTHESLMGMAKSKFNYLCNKGMWGAKSHNDDKIVAMTATINKLKEQLKMSPQLTAVVEMENKKKKGQKNKNKKDIKAIMSNRKGTKLGRKFRQKKEKSKRRSMAGIPTSSASTIWPGLCILPKTATLERSKRGRTRLPIQQPSRPPWQPRSIRATKLFSPP